MKNLKKLLIETPHGSENCQSILKREIPQLRVYVGDYNDFAVAVPNTKAGDFRRVEFCPNCHECDKYMTLTCSDFQNS